MRLDLGSGPTPLDGHLGLDLMEVPPFAGKHSGVWKFRLDTGQTWPFANNSIEGLHSSHLIEHLPAANVDGKDILARFFEEAWRIAMPGALFNLRWPSIIDEETGRWLPSAFYDPTHRRWIPKEQLLYFSCQGREHLGVEQYDFRCNWTLVTVGQRSLTTDRSVLEYHAVLRRDPLWCYPHDRDGPGLDNTRNLPHGPDGKTLEP